MLEARAFEPGFLRRLDGLVLGVQRSRTVREGQRMLGRVQGLGIQVNPAQAQVRRTAWTTRSTMWTAWTSSEWAA